MDNRIYSPSTARNRSFIAEALLPRLPKGGSVLEIASGSGEHATHFTPIRPDVTWQPSNLEEDQILSTESWRAHVGTENFLPVLKLDVTGEVWPTEAPDYSHGPFDAIFNANMIHIAPWVVTEGLFKGANRVLKKGGFAYLYGPYKVGGKHTSESNIAFEEWLKAKDSSFGVRDIEKVAAEAEKNGLLLKESLPMPANNFFQIFEKQ
ncbi:DUF938 domain-containing protein [Sneathiella sp. P13V-1]|uniref:DUF938 domain-containing protein n=1 Tax=Sneathiella sp. P13V-1 TaxID=2697366 RepID=UPI00187B384D|nr:DUF938 domain-containing protein [Sneathiella sp. P13V-1]MBE7635491.1 DUF938 domain-containing protein [Sneathiella sp. P13V-1]